VKQFKETPVLVRIQRENEAIYEAYGLLEKAMGIKNSLRGFLIKTHQEQDSLFIINWEQKNDNKISIIESPSYQVSKYLNSSSNFQSKSIYFKKEM